MHDQEFVEYVVKALVEHPEDVRVERKTDDLGVLIELTVNPDDMGKIIGKEGRTAKSIRTLLRVLGAKSDERVNMKIIEPGGDVVALENDQEEVALIREEVQGDEPAEAPPAPAEPEETAPPVPRLQRDPELSERNPLDEIQL